MHNLYIVDASGYLYSSYFAIRHMTNEKGESTNAIFGFIRSLLKLSKDFNPQHMVAVFDGPRGASKRVALYEHYKAHRQSMPEDLRYQISWAQDYCDLMGIPWLAIPEVEADDTIGSVAAWAKQRASKVFICSSDKDLCQCVDDKVNILNTYKDNAILGPEEVETQFGVPPAGMVDYLALVGDSSDNVPGLPGFGPKTAAKLLKQFSTLDNLLENAAAIPEEKKRLILLEKGEIALLSRQLVEIDTSVTIPLEEHFYTLRNPAYEELKAFFANLNFHSLLKELAGKQPQPQHQEPEKKYHLVDDEASLSKMLATLNEQNSICLYTEATDSHPLKAELVGIGFGIKPGEAWYLPTNGKLGLNRCLEAIKPLLENEAIGFYSHNIKFDLQVLKNYNIEVSNLGFDTVLASYLLNSQSRQHSIEALVLELFGKVKIDVKELIGRGKSSISMGEVAIPKVCEYCCENVNYTIQLKELFSKEIAERNLTWLLNNLELPLVRVLAAMERHGIFVDKELLASIAEEVNEQIAQRQKNIFLLADEEFNLNSPKQLGLIFQKLSIATTKKTTTGQIKTDFDVLEALKSKYPIAAEILEYRALEKMRSTYIEALPISIFPSTQRIHCTFNQVVAATGRLSCQDPNLQNIPIRSPWGRRIREAFRPQLEGWSYLAADYSQIELRLLAHFSEDENLLEAFQLKQDVHAHTASVIFGVTLNQVTPAQRHQAKAVNFGIIYGQQAFGLSQELSIPVKAAAQFIEMYFKRYSRVQQFIEGCKEKARQTGKAVTLTGRERSIPEIHSKNGTLRALAERLAINTPLQGTAADLIKMAMLKIEEQLHPHFQGYMILQIHDELIFELPDHEVAEMKELVREAMQNVVHLKVPLIVDIMVGKNWKEC